MSLYLFNVAQYQFFANECLLDTMVKLGYNDHGYSELTVITNRFPWFRGVSLTVLYNEVRLQRPTQAQMQKLDSHNY